MPRRGWEAAVTAWRVSSGLRAKARPSRSAAAAIPFLNSVTSPTVLRETKSLLHAQTIIPAKFIPPTPQTRPTTLFPGTVIDEHTARFVRTTPEDNRRQCLVFTDGCCRGNGTSGARAGWSFVAGPGATGAVRGRLENRGPSGEAHAQTNNRAELRAALAALRSRDWAAEGFAGVVVATDSGLVVDGATEWCAAWVANGWVLAGRGRAVKNRDLWLALLGRVAGLRRRRTEVLFWKIGREWNSLADEGANEGAMMEEVEWFVDFREEGVGGQKGAALGDLE